MIIIFQIHLQVSSYKSLQKQMTDVSNDPLRFLNIKKKRQINKQRITKKISTQQIQEQTSHFVMPTFNSQNSLENEQISKFKKTYNPSKYFNPEIQEYLNKKKQIKIANLPIMQLNNNYLQQKNSQSKKIQNDFIAKAQKVQPNQFIDLSNNENLVHKNNEIKTAYNFYKPGLKKSGSMKMMQRIQQSAPLNQQKQLKKNPIIGISPWQLPQNAQLIQQLRPCQICGRNFNQKSYHIHVKVCQKVFFQKRKPFNSRSKSKQKKQKNS